MCCQQFCTGWMVLFALATTCHADNLRPVDGERNRGTSGVAPGQSVNLASLDMQGAKLSGADLTNRDFKNANLSYASLTSATLTNAILSGANVRGASFGNTTSRGFTKEQLYSTASYQAKDLRDVVFSDYWTTNDLTEWDFSGQDLTGTSFRAATLTNADLTDAIVANADFTGASARGLTKEMLYDTASYKAKNLRGIWLGGIHSNTLFLAVSLPSDLTGWDFSNQDLSDARFWQATLTGADFADAVVAGANFHDTTSRGFTPEQLYATASYKAKNLQGISLSANDLSGWDFHEQDLSGAEFVYRAGATANLSHANLAGANLMNSNFSPDGNLPVGDVLTDADFTGADLRGARVTGWDSATTRNTILPNGKIATLELLAGERLLVRDDDGLSATLPSGIPSRSPFAVAIHDGASFASDGVLQLEFDADPWDSVIHFEPGIPVELGGMLELTFSNEVNVAEQVGRTLRLFDWTGVSPTGRFEIQSPYVWDTTNLYSTGQVTLRAVPEPSTALIALPCGVVLVAAYRPRLPKRTKRKG